MRHTVLAVLVLASTAWVLPNEGSDWLPFVDYDDPVHARPILTLDLYSNYTARIQFRVDALIDCAAVYVDHDPGYTCFDSVQRGRAVMCSYRPALVERFRLTPDVCAMDAKRIVIHFSMDAKPYTIDFQPSSRCSFRINNYTRFILHEQTAFPVDLGPKPTNANSQSSHNGVPKPDKEVVQELLVNQDAEHSDSTVFYSSLDPETTDELIYATPYAYEDNSPLGEPKVRSFFDREVQTSRHERESEAQVVIDMQEDTRQRRVGQWQAPDLEQLQSQATGQHGSEGEHLESPNIGLSSRRDRWEWLEGEDEVDGQRVKEATRHSTPITDEKSDEYYWIETDPIGTATTKNHSAQADEDEVINLEGLFTDN